MLSCRLRASLSPLGAFLRPSWRQLGTVLGPSGCHVEPSCSQDSLKRPHVAKTLSPNSQGAHLGEPLLSLVLPQLMLLLLLPLLLLLLQLLLLLVVLAKPSQLLRLLLPARSSNLYVNYRSANNKYFVDSFGMSVQCRHKVETTYKEQKLS